MFWKIVAGHETHNSAVSYEASVEGNERASGDESLPWAQEAATQTRSSSKNVSVQFRTKSTAKGKFLKLCRVFEINMVLRKKPFGYAFPAIQITAPTKSQGTQCTLLKELFVTSTPCASDGDPSDPEEEMDADDDSLYVPGPEDEMNEDGEFAHVDDCLYE